MGKPRHAEIHKGGVEGFTIRHLGPITLVSENSLIGVGLHCPVFESYCRVRSGIRQGGDEEAKRLCGLAEEEGIPSCVGIVKRKLIGCSLKELYDVLSIDLSDRRRARRGVQVG